MTFQMYLVIQCLVTVMMRNDQRGWDKDTVKGKIEDEEQTTKNEQGSDIKQRSLIRGKGPG